jgi:ribose transport system substrate-binding protein
VLAGAAGLMAACATRKSVQIGVVPKGRAHLFWQSVHAGAVKASRELGVEVIWNGPAVETDYSGQIQIVESLIARRVDAIALAPIDRKVMVNVVERAAAQKIPVVIFDSGIDTDKFVAQVATDNFLAGELAAQRMGEVLGGKGRIVIVAVQPGAASTMAREEGFETRLRQQFPAIEIADKRYGYADFAKSLAVAENMLTAHPGLSGLFASNESSSAGAAQALKSRRGQVKMVGFDWSPALVDDLKNGVVDSLIIQNPFLMGQESVIAAAKAIRGEAVTKMNNLAPRLVTKDDLSKPEVQEHLNPDLKRYLG